VLSGLRGDLIGRYHNDIEAWLGLEKGSKLGVVLQAESD
jgi:hypothetical protein